jgi:hypothetical protein
VRLFGSSRWNRNQFGEFAKVLSCSGEMELVAGAIWTPQAEFSHSEDALEMREQHLDLLPLATGLDIGLGLRDVLGNVTRRFVD